jgi:RimJ/RimL family protein N-acetyltransferase
MLSRMFIGEKIRLTALRTDDIPVVVRWYHDSDFMRNFDGNPAFPRTEESWKKWFEENTSAKNQYFFAIRPLDSEDLLGWVFLDDISMSHRNGWIALAFGDESNRGKGYGYEAMQLLLQFVFHELNLYRVQLTVFEYNTRAIRLYEKLGFVREGTFREHLQRDGRRHDMYLYGLLVHEWEKQL